MELSPEERQRIYAEEKFRLESQNAIRSEKKHGIGTWIIGGYGIILFIIALLSAVSATA